MAEATKKPEEETVDFLEEVAGVGFDNITAEDRSLPFLKIAQLLSPEIEEDNVDLIKGLELGMFFNSMTKRIYGNTIKLIPVRFEKTWLEWKPKRGGFLGSHIPDSIEVDKSDFSEWRTEKGTVISENFMFYCLAADHIDEGPLLYAMTSTGIKHAKNWNSAIMLCKLPSGKQCPYFGNVWELATQKNISDSGNYYQIGAKSSNITRDRRILPEEYTNYVAPMHKEIVELQKRVDFAMITDEAQTKQVTDETESKY